MLLNTGCSWKFCMSIANNSIKVQQIYPLVLDFYSNMFLRVKNEDMKNNVATLIPENLNYQKHFLSYWTFETTCCYFISKNFSLLYTCCYEKYHSNFYSRKFKLPKIYISFCIKFLKQHVAKNKNLISNIFP